MKEEICKGLLFIGDPHLSSRRPGRRTDTNFAETVLDKLAQAFQITRKNHWQPVILGDLFDRAGEQDLSLLSGLLRLLRDHRHIGGLIPVTLAGNHDLKDANLSRDTALSVIHESGLLQVLEDAKPFFVYRGLADGDLADGSLAGQTDSCIAVLFPYSYGQEDRLLQDGLADGSLADGSLADGRPIRSVRRPDASAGYKPLVIALTHADFAFAGAYPCAKEIVEVQGVDMVVNGHMHKLCPTVRRGRTLWWNPGNITRMSMDCESHAPRVWSWQPGEDTLTGIHLRHEKLVFNRAGVAVKPDVDGLKEELDQVGQMDEPMSSRFVQMLKEQQAQESPLTEDASGLMTEIQAVCQEQKACAMVSDILQQMLGSLIDAH